MKKKLLFISITIVITILIILLLGELILRLTWDGKPDIPEDPPTSLVFHESPYKDVSFLLIPNHYYKKRQIRTNKYGFRLRSNISEKKPEGIYRILALGDSVMYGHATEEWRTIPRRMEELFRKARIPGIRKIEVLNLGMGGHNISQYTAVLKHYGTLYNPDHIVVGITVYNDFDGHMLRYLGNGWLENSPKHTIHGYGINFHAPSKLVRSIKLAWFYYVKYYSQKLRVEVGRKMKPKDNKPTKLLLASRDPNDTLWKEVHKNLEDMKNIAKELGIGITVLIFPSNEQVYWEDIDIKTQEIFKTHLDELGMKYIDYYDEFVRFLRASSYQPFKDYNSHPATRMHMNIAGIARDSILLENFPNFTLPSKRMIELGNHENLQFLSFGWSNIVNKDRRFRWIDGNHARINFGKMPREIKSITFKAHAYKNDPDLKLTVTLNGKSAEPLIVSKDSRTYKISFKEPVALTDLNTLDLETNKCWTNKKIKKNLLHNERFFSIGIEYFEFN